MKPFAILARLVLLVGLVPSAAFAQSFPPFDVVWQQTFPGTLQSVAFSPDGQYVGAGGIQSPAPDRGHLLIWDAADGTVRLDTRHGADINAVAFTPDGSAFITAHAGTVCAPKGPCSGFGHELVRWAAPDGGLLLNVPFDQAYLSIEFTPDGQTFVGGNRTSPFGFAPVFHEPVSFDSLRALPAYTAPDIAFSPDGSRLVTGGFENLQYDGAAQVWDLATNTVALELPHRANSEYEIDFPESVAYSPDGSLIATGGWGSFIPRVMIWRASDGALLHNIDARTEPVDGYGGLGTHVVFSPNGHYLLGATSYEPASERQDLVVRIWEVATGELVAEYGMAGEYGNRGIRAFAVSPTDDVFAITTDNGVTDILVARTSLDLASPVTTDASSADAPAGFRLSAAAPNPAPSVSTLTLDLAVGQHVRAEVYDALGRRVAVLQDGVLAAGTHPLQVRGAGLPSGLYHVRVEGETFAASRRVTLVR